MKKLKFLFPLLFMVLIAVLSSCKGHQKKATAEPEADLSAKYRNLVHSKFQAKAQAMNADTRYLIIVDYSILSNHDRLFVWDTEEDRIVEKFWCAHGYGKGSTAEKPVFSNTDGSYCSSLGWYLVDRGVGKSPRWGYNYHAVDGLDATNSNARRRQILIHPWSSVDNDYRKQIDHPMKPDGRCQGCFTTTHEGFQTIDRYVKSRQKRLLLWAIDGV